MAIKLTLIQCGLTLTKSIPKALFPIGSQSEVLGRHEFWATFHPTTTLRWEERFSQGRRVRGGVGLKLRPVLFQSGLLPPLTASQLSPFVQLNQSFITFKLLGTSILTAFQGPGLWKSHFCWPRPPQGTTVFTLFSGWLGLAVLADPWLSSTQPMAK